MADPTRTTVAREEYARALRRLPVEARREMERLITSAPIVDESVLEEVKKVIDRHVAEGGEEIVKRFTPLLWQRGSDFAVAQLKRAGVEVVILPSLGVIDSETLTHLSNLQLDLVRGLSDDLKKQVVFQIREGLLKGESVRQLAERIREVTRSAKYKAERIARTETIRVFNTAAVDRYEKAGVKRWRWYAAMDERTCPICGPRHNRVFKMGDPVPPAHPNCRCTVVPEITPPGGRREKGEEKETGVTGDEKLDRGIRKTLAEFEKTLEKEEGNYLRAVNRIVNNGKPLMPTDSEKALKKIYKKHFSGAPKSLKEKMELSLLTRVNKRVIESASKVKIVGKKTGRSYYNPLKKEISLVTQPEWDQWRRFLHEYGHHLDEEVFAEESRKFYLARVRKHGYKHVRLIELEGFEHAGWDEVAFEGFRIEGLKDSPYAGRYYSRPLKHPRDIETVDELRTEVVSMGLQYFMDEDTIRKFYKGDKEYFGFILHLMQGGTL